MPFLRAIGIFVVFYLIALVIVANLGSMLYDGPYKTIPNPDYGETEGYSDGLMYDVDTNANRYIEVQTEENLIQENEYKISFVLSLLVFVIIASKNKWNFGD